MLFMVREIFEKKLSSLIERRCVACNDSASHRSQKWILSHNFWCIIYLFACLSCLFWTKMWKKNWDCWKSLCNCDLQNFEETQFYILICMQTERNSQKTERNCYRLQLYDHRLSLGGPGAITVIIKMMSLNTLEIHETFLKILSFLRTDQHSAHR